eukprot:709439_1
MWVLHLMAIAIVQCRYVWQQNNATLSLPNINSTYADYSMAAATNNHSVFLIGGTKNRYQLAIFDINTEIFIYYNDSIAPETVGTGQFYTQIDNGLIMISTKGADTSLTYFDLDTITFTTDWVGVAPYDFGGAACLASTNDFIFILGGDHSGYKSSVQILNISANRWSIGSNMNERRGHFACIVHTNHDSNNTLYAIGAYTGYSAFSNTIERTELSNITSLSWSYIGNLLYYTYGDRAVAYEDYIFVVGGRGKKELGDSTEDIDEFQVINTLSGNVTSGGYLSYPTRVSGVVSIGHIIYAFCGIENVRGQFKAISRWQYCDLTLTLPPTADPTQEPTIIPTKGPTTHPSQFPSVSPTEVPTNMPSIVPTANPTVVPTDFPIPLPSTTEYEEIDGDWIIKVNGENCGDGFKDLSHESRFYGLYCKRCSDGTAGTYGNCYQCGTLEEPNDPRTECEFVNPWWLYLLETLVGLGIVTCIGSGIVYFYKKSKSIPNQTDTETGIGLQSYTN